MHLHEIFVSTHYVSWTNWSPDSGSKSVSNIDWYFPRLSSPKFSPHMQICLVLFHDKLHTPYPTNMLRFIIYTKKIQCFFLHTSQLGRIYKPVSKLISPVQRIRTVLYSIVRTVTIEAYWSIKGTLFEEKKTVYRWITWPSTNKESILNLP
jgi:hypothetical protein